MRDTLHAWIITACWFPTTKPEAQVDPKIFGRTRIKLGNTCRQQEFERFNRRPSSLTKLTTNHILRTLCLSLETQVI
jgi:hypothetical protein